ncbi:MAG: HisS family protein [Dehalococcoidales bacterium]|nr:HisS family protein [Dehalococcoidales bacterium]
MRIQRCKGSRDLTPEQMLRFRFVEKAFRRCCLKWGYEEVKTPVLEYLNLFTSTGTLTPGMLSKVYSFLDWDGWSGQRLVLRPDGTIPLARLYIDNIAVNKKLARLFYTSNIFRFEETGQETRERWQGGVELIGVSSSLADVELILLALEVLAKMGIKGVELKLSHAGLVRSLLSELGLSDREQTRILDQVLDGDSEAFARIKAERPDLGRAMVSLLDLEGKTPGFLKNLRALFGRSVPELVPVVDDFISIVELLDAVGCDYQIDITSGKGFEYYTGVIFQLFHNGDKIGGGGRYDALIPLMGGGDIPASGFALYFDCLMNLLEPAALAGPLEQRVLVKVEREAVKKGLDITASLRDAGYVAELFLEGQQPSNLRWLLDVRNEVPSFVLHDSLKIEDIELETAGEVLTLLGESNGDKDSPA